MHDLPGSCYAPATRVVVDLIDPAFNSGDRSREVDPEIVQDVMQSNKYSRELLDGTPYETNRATDDQARRRTREEQMHTVTAELNDAGVRYASMKNLRGPKVVMSDIDLLIPDHSSVGRAVLTLSEAEYDLYQFRLLAHPLKVMAKQSPTDTRPVDIYPDAIWMRKVVCDAETVVERADESSLRMPAPEDDLYLVATHSYSHLNIRFADIFHGVRCIESASHFDWEYLVEVAQKYGCADGMYVYFSLLDQHLAVSGRERVPKKVFESLASGVVPRLASGWVNQLERPLKYPVQIPVWLANVASSIYHSPRVARQEGLYKAYKDFQSHYLSLSSKLLLGET